MSSACKNQSKYWNDNKMTNPDILHKNALRMLCNCINRNSTLIYASLKHINSLHKRYPKYSFKFTDDILKEILQITTTFNNKISTTNIINDFLLFLYASMEYPFGGVRHETLLIFEYWIRNERTATEIFKILIQKYSWINKNKYYFLTILLTKYNLYKLIENCSELENITKDSIQLNGITLSLKYRHLISPGQQLVGQLTEQNNVEIYVIIENIVKNGTDFEIKNCINQWLCLIKQLNKIYDHLELSQLNILTFSNEENKFNYLYKNNMLRLILLRKLFKIEFEQHTQIKLIDQCIFANYKNYNDIQKISLYTILFNNMNILNNIRNFNEFSENLTWFTFFLEDNLNTECTQLRHEILKNLPNLLNSFSTNLVTENKSIRNNNNNFSIMDNFNDDQLLFKNRIGNLFTFFKLKIFENGCHQIDYQPTIFALRIFEIILKYFYGTRDDHLIKCFDKYKIEQLKSILLDNWLILSIDNVQILINLLKNDYDDIRNLSCDIIIRFFKEFLQVDSNNDLLIYDLCKNTIINTDLRVCNYAQHYGKIYFSKINDDRFDFYQFLKTHLSNMLQCFNDDPLNYSKFYGFHFFGPLNVLNEFYKLLLLNNNNNIEWLNESEDIKLCNDILELLLQLLNFPNNINSSYGSPSFEKMDESLTLLVQKSKYKSTNIQEDKKFLLTTIWMSLKVI